MIRNTDNSWGAVGGFALVAALISSAFFLRGSLETRRPEQQAAVLAEVAADEFVLARLWQDPLLAIQTDWDGIASAEPRTSLPLDVRGVRSKLSKESGAQLRLLVMMSGAPYAEDRENRRRQRHAVVSALTENDYVPKDAERLGYFTAPCFEERCRRRSSARLQNVGEAQQKMLIGFESYERALEGGNERAKLLWDSIVVLWLNSEDFETCALNQASALASYLDGEGEPATTVLVGPTKSGDLSRLRPIGWYGECGRAVVDWLDGSLGTGPPGLTESEAAATGIKARYTRLHVLSPRATAPLDLLFPDRNGEFRTCVRARLTGESTSTDEATSADSCLAEYLRVASFDSVVARDDAVLSTILQELRDRGASRLLIAIVSEQDSAYGRLLDDVVEDVLCPDQEHDRDGQKERFEVREYGYLAGVDGEMPPTAVLSDVRREAGVGSTANGSPESSLVPRGHLEAAFGEAQLDYVRRLADHIAYDLKNPDLDANGNRHCEGPNGSAVENGSMRAVVGVLGTDVYDKLAILEALRDKLLFATFFTTDLDARFSHPGVYRFTRNLIVGSAYGLTVKDLSGAPFRDSYQTATYRAVALALELRNGRFSKRPRAPNPRLFEIGRTGPVDITARQTGTVEADFEQIHGDVPYIRSPMPVTRYILEGLLLLPLVLLTLYALVSKMALNGAKDDPRVRARRHVVWVGVVSAIILAFLMWRPWDTRFEPSPFFEGVNSLPTMVLSLATLVCAFSTFWMAKARLEQGKVALREEWDLPESMGCSRWTFKDLSALLRWREREWWPRLFEWKRDVGSGAGPPQKKRACEVWRKYLQYSDCQAQIARVCFPLILSFVFVLAFASEKLFTAPLLTRGLDRLLTLVGCVTTLGVLFVVFFCNDVLKLGHTLLREIALHDFQWPKGSRDSRHRRTMRFLEAYTNSVMPIVALPFLLLTLLIFARSTLFEGWVWAQLLLVPYAGLVGYVSVRALRFRFAAEKAKETVLTCLDGDRLRMVGERKAMARLEIDRERIEESREGAFGPWIRHPIVQSSLLPSVGYAVVRLLESLN